MFRRVEQKLRPLFREPFTGMREVSLPEAILLATVAKKPIVACFWNRGPEDMLVDRCLVYGSRYECSLLELFEDAVADPFVFSFYVLTT